MSSHSLSNTVALELVRRIVDFNVDLISDKAIELSKVAILDKIGVTLAAVNVPSIRNLITAIEAGSVPGAMMSAAPGLASVLGTRFRSGVLDATIPSHHHGSGRIKSSSNGWTVVASSNVSVRRR